MDRAGQLRQQHAASKEPGISDGPDDSDVSSEEDYELGADSDDVDSEDLEDEVMVEASSANDHHLSQQDDFVQF